jgi:hypothetical protein
MAFSPAAPLVLNFNINNPGFAFQEVMLEPPVTPIGGIEIQGSAPWAVFSNIYYDGNINRIRFTVSVNLTYASTMQPGDYNFFIRVRYVFALGATNSPWYEIMLNVGDYVPLTVAPSSLTFSHNLGQANPQPLSLSINTENVWTASASETWVSLSQTNGQGDASIVVTVDPTGLLIGQYSAVITVQDSQTERQITVFLGVAQANDQANFLFITPYGMEFISEIGEPNTTTQELTIEASDNWTAEINDAWLNLSATSGTAGVTVLDVSVDSAALTNTEVPYLTELRFVMGNRANSIYIRLFILNPQTEGIESEALYFSDDRNYFNVTSTLPNMFLYLEGIISNSIQNEIYKLRAPFQNGLASVLFGMETNVLLIAPPPSANFITRIKNNISPVNISFSAYNKQRFNGSSLIIDSFSNVRFLTGKTPEVANKLNYAPSHIFVTKDAKISLSCLSTEGINNIEVTGDHTATYTTVIDSGLLVYNAIVDLAPMQLQVGDNITIAFGPISLDVTIKPKGLEQHIIAFMNEWREFEFFEFTGSLKLDNKPSIESTEVQQEAQTHTKVVDIKSSKDYSIETGQIYSQEEIDWLHRLIEHSRRTFIYREGKFNEIVLSSNSLNQYTTRTAFNSFKLKFKSAIVE